MDIMDKTEQFLTALKEFGVELTAGQTAIVCNDGVVLVNMDMENGGCDMIVCNSKIHVDYDLGITDEDVELFRTVAGVAQELEDQIEEIGG